MNIISVSPLTRRSGQRTGIDQINLDVPEGALFGFLGPNGAGKTTLIRVLLGFLTPTSPNASVLNLDCWAPRTTLNPKPCTYPEICASTPG